MQKIAKTMFIMLFLTIAAFAWGQSIFWEDTFDANNGWTLGTNWSIATGELKLSWTPTQTNYDLSALSPNITVPAAAGDLVISQYLDEYTGQGTPPETFEIAVMVNGTPNVLWTYNTDADWGVTGGQNLTLSLAAYAGQTVQLRFRSFGGSTFNFNYWHIYGVTAYASLNQDLAAVSVTGPAGPAQGAAASYVVTVRNTGSTAAASYTVKLMKDTTTELGSQTGTNLAPNATQDFTFSWTPQQAGVCVLNGKVIFTGDQNPNNDISPPLNVDVQPINTILVPIGNGTSTQRQPFGIYWGYERNATLYTQDQMNQYGPILALRWNCQTGAAAVAPYKIYIKTTTETTMTAATWDTFVADATLVKQGTQAFAAPGWYNFSLDTPYMYTSGNLIVIVETFYTGTGVSPYPLFYYTVGGAGQNQYWYADNNPPTTAGNLNTFKPNIGILFSGAGMSHLTGTVSVGAAPLAGATVSIGNTTMTTTTNASGVYDFPYVIPGTYPVTASKIGYTTVTQNVTLTADQTSTLNFTLVGLPVVNVTGTVEGSEAQGVGLADATVTLVGVLTYTATTGANGQFSIPVLSSNTYAYTISKTGYQNATGNITVGTTNYPMGVVVLNEIALPATGVQAAENAAHTVVNVTWMAPGTGGGEWIHYDTGENNDSIGTGAAADFDVAVRFPASALGDYAGMSLYSLKVWPAQAGTFSLRVWTGGTAAAPGTMVVDQPFTPVLDTYNEVLLTTPVPVTGSEELWFGYRCNVTSGYPAGCDAGPATDGFGNMMYFQGAWSTLLALAPSLNYNWNIQGFVGYGAPTRVAPLQPLVFNADRFNTGTLSGFGKVDKIQNATVINNVNDIRTLIGYKVWRLLVGQETNEAAWTSLTPNPITAEAFPDAGWATVVDGQYKWAVKAVYTNNVMSIPAFSNMVEKLTQIGTIAGFVRTATTPPTPISGATVTAGTVTATTNATGAYTMTVPAGTYTVTATKSGYAAGVQNGVVVVTGQTTTVNFNLAIAPTWEDSFETYTDFAIDFAPWVNVDVDASSTYSYTGYSWANMQVAQSFMVFNPSTTTPASTAVIGAPRTGSKMATCWAAVTFPNNDWLISPIFNVGPGAAVSFYAKSMTDEYGLERFKVGYSTGATTPASFTLLSGANYVQAPLDWTAYSYNLPANVTGNVRIGIQCVSNDAFCFQLDDFVMNLGGSANEDNNTPVVATALNGCYPNPFNPTTTISYSVKGTTPVTVEIFNAKGQKVKTLVNEAKAQGNYKVAWNGLDENGNKVTSGVYFYKMNAGKFSSSKKMILMK